MRWDVFCAVIGCVNFVIWVSIAHLLHKRLERAEAAIRAVRTRIDDHKLDGHGFVHFIGGNAAESGQAPGLAPKEDT